MAEYMVKFIQSRNGKKVVINAENDEHFQFFKPIMDALVYEGNYHIKIPCYNISTINPDWPTKCERGNKWSTEASYYMAGADGKGDISTEHVELEFFDNFHRVDSMFPHHLPQIEDWKTCNHTQEKECKLKGWTVSENYYEKLDALDAGAAGITAWETKAKLLSRQMVMIHAGHPNASFHELDENDHACMDINKKAYELGKSWCSKEALDRYEKYGKKMVFAHDHGPLNAGPLWIWTYLSMTDNADKTETTVVSPYMSTPADYWESQVRGFHYCKLLNPSRVMEYIYVDSLYDHDGRLSFEEKYPELAKEKMFLQ